MNAMNHHMSYDDILLAFMRSNIQKQADEALLLASLDKTSGIVGGGLLDQQTRNYSWPPLLIGDGGVVTYSCSRAERSAVSCNSNMQQGYHGNHESRGKSDLLPAPAKEDDWLRTPFQKRQDIMSSSNLLDEYHVLFRIVHHAADSHFRAKQYERALLVYMNALQLTLDVCGVNHIDVATSLNCAGLVQLHVCTETKSGDINLAIQFFNQSLEVLRLCQEDGLYVADVLTNLGKAQYCAGKYESAFSNHQEAYRIRKMILDETHLDVAQSLFQAAMCNDMLKADAFLSLHLYQKYLGIFVPQLGTHYSDVVTAYVRSGDIYLERESYNNAIDMYTKAMTAAKETYGPNHIIIAEILTKVGDTKYKLGDFSSASHAYSECLDLQRRVLSSHDLNIVVTLLNIARVYQQEGFFHESLQVYLEALHIQISRSEQDKQSTLNASVTLECIGTLQDVLGRSTEAIKSYERSLVLKISALGSNHFEVSSILNAIGIIQFKEGLYQAAIASFEQGLEIRKSLPSCTSHDFAALLFNIGAVYAASGDSDKAIFYFKTTLDLEKEGGESNLFTSMNIIRHIGNLYANRGEYREALKYFDEGIQSIQNSSQNFNLSGELATFYSLSGTVYLEQGDTENAVRCLMKAIHHERVAGVSGESDIVLRTLIVQHLASVEQVACAAAA